MVMGVERRKLPSWMLGVTADKLVPTSDEQDTPVSLEEQPSTSQPHDKSIVKTRRNRVITHEKDLSSLDITKKRTKRSNKQCVDLSISVTKFSEISDQKKSKMNSHGVEGVIQEYTLTDKENMKNQKLKSGDGKTESISSSGDWESRTELTMEDIMSIAEEYVKEDEKKYQQCPRRKEDMNTKISTEETEGSSSSSMLTKELLSDISRAKKENDSSTTKDLAVCSKITGDPARDMLDLLLGPWLKNPPTEEEEKTKLSVENLNFITPLVGNSKKVESKISVKEEVCSTKKKSSLKDKVARFLD